MKDRLHKATLKVNGVDFSSGRQLLERLHTNDARRYPLDGGVRLSVFTNQGTLHVQTAPSFVFDGRSGPRIVDWYAPNLGNIVLPRLIKSPYKTKMSFEEDMSEDEILSMCAYGSVENGDLTNADLNDDIEYRIELKELMSTMLDALGGAKELLDFCETHLATLERCDRYEESETAKALDCSFTSAHKEPL